ncbi:MAG: flagellar hook-length control protein FliK [Gammaproteobacteria bacterium]
MLPMLNGPLSLDAVTVPDNALGPGLMGFSGQKGPFSDIMANLQNAADPTAGPTVELPETAKALENLPIPPALMDLFKELVADGNNLPEEANAFLEELKLEFKNLIEENPSPGNLKLLQKLFDKVSEAIEKIELSFQQLNPDAIQNTELPADQTNAEMLKTLKTLQQELEELSLSLNEQINSLTKQVMAEPKAERSPALSDKTPATEVVTEDAGEKGNPNTVVDQSNAPINLAGEIKPEEVILSDKRPAKQAVTAQLAANDKKADGFFKPNQAALNQAGTSQPGLNGEAEIELPVNAKAIDVKNVVASTQIMGGNAKNVPAAHSSAWLHSQAIAGKMGTESGFSGMQSNNSGTSFAQMMSQASPAPLTQNLHTSQWGQALGQRIAWMIGNKLQSAQLRITPAHLGPVEIKLSIEKNQAQVSFVSQHQVVRDAIEQAVPRLREMFEQQNLDLGDVDVSDRKLAGQGAGNENLAGFSDDNDSTGTAENTSENDMPEEQQATQLGSDGLLDAYA